MSIIHEEMTPFFSARKKTAKLTVETSFYIFKNKKKSPVAALQTDELRAETFAYMQDI